MFTSFQTKKFLSEFTAESIRGVFRYVFSHMHSFGASFIPKCLTGMVDWKQQFMEASGVAAFKPLSPGLTGIWAKISVS